MTFNEVFIQDLVEHGRTRKEAELLAAKYMAQMPVSNCHLTRKEIAELKAKLKSAREMLNNSPGLVEALTKDRDRTLGKRNRNN